MGYRHPDRCELGVPMVGATSWSGHPFSFDHEGAGSGFPSTIVAPRKPLQKTDFVSRQTDNVTRRICPRTAAKYLDFPKSLFNWCADEAGLIEHSPFAKLAIKFSKKNSTVAAAATTDALQAILMSPLFQGHHLFKLHQPGQIVTRKDFYWGLLLQFYCGARIGEIAQLRVADVRIAAPIPYIHFRKLDDQGQPINGNTLKTANAERKMPICDDLIALGFLDFVRSRRGVRSYLLPDIAPSRNQKSSSRASKIAQRYLVQIGQKAPRKATHWLRHALVNALRRSQTPDYLLNYIVGHAQTGSQSYYGNAEDLLAARKALNAADYGFSPLAILRLSEDRWAQWSR